MNKNAIQKYAIWARNELIEQVKQRAYQYGISSKSYGDENAAVIAGRVLSADEKRQRAAFVSEIKRNGFEQAVEDVAYTWFNRFVALRFMEVNDYLPTHVRVFSDASGGFNPEILKDVLHLELEGLDKSKVSEMLNANQTEELYRYLLLTQCNALNAALPEMFEKLGTYTEMLLPNNILKQESALAHLVKDIDEDDWKDAVQIIGWMYQYYNTEPKQAVFDGLKKNVKITKEKIPAATQLFTPDWIVRYMVENSLGRLWLESHPNDALKANWKYYLDEAEQTPEVTEKLRVMRSQSPVKSPEDIRLIDPCMGSGHILVYAFDVLMQIYESVGISPREAAKLILQKNIYGLDIDRRAYQLAYFSLMMKARQYNRRIFNEKIKPQVFYPAGWSDGEEYGSLAKVDSLPPMPELSKGQFSIFDDYERDLRVWNFKRLLAQKYDVVVTNPPYMAMTNAGVKVNEYVKKNYPDSKTDFFAVFIERCSKMTQHSGYQAMITQQSFYFLSGLEKLRKNIIRNDILVNSVHMGLGAFGNDFGTVAFVFRKVKSFKGYQGRFLYLGEKKSVEEKEVLFLSPKCPQYYHSLYEFEKLPNCTYSYTASAKTFEHFGKNSMSEQFLSGGRNKTHNDDIYLRLHWEVKNTSDKWIPYGKGGEFRRWYGNHYYVVDWGVTARSFYASHGGLCNSKFWGQEGLTWSFVTSYKPSFRFKPKEMIYSSVSPTVFRKDFSRDFYVLGLLNSNVGLHFLEIISSTIGTNVGEVLNFPVVRNQVQAVVSLVEENVLLCKSDWDSFEVSSDFLRHPLLLGKTAFEAYSAWRELCCERFERLKKNETLLNEIFIDNYELHGEVDAEVEERDVESSCRHAELQRDIKSFLSYAVGCMFGRYSLDAEGLAYAGGDWDNSKYKTFIPDKDNILPICDDEYFDDDILGRFVDFVRVVYGSETLEENLKFIADALGGKGTPREVIRNYFLNDFYKDHCKIYQKHPIYWLFDSGKKNGFKSLVYLHRYTPDLLAKLRTDYVHEQQERYRTQLSHIATALNTAAGSERARLLKQQDKLSEQLKEITAFEEKVHHLADQNIEIDLDDGVKKNYEIFTDVLAKI